MGFRNNNTGYPNNLLNSRSIIKKGEYALITPDGMVNNIIPNFTNCNTTILSSPKLGASFVDYLVDFLPYGKFENFGGYGVESFLFIIEGSAKATVKDENFSLESGSYIYCPANSTLSVENTSSEITKSFLYKRRYTPAPNLEIPPIVHNNISNLEPIYYESMDNLKFYNLLPANENLSFDMNFHILSFEQSASHGYIETHIQEHGAYILSGEGMYNLGGNWIPVKKDDYIFMGAYTLQGAYAIGNNLPFSYVYSKDCNRDVII